MLTITGYIFDGLLEKVVHILTDDGNNAVDSPAMDQFGMTDYLASVAKATLVISNPFGQQIETLQIDQRRTFQLFSACLFAFPPEASCGWVAGRTLVQISGGIPSDF